MPFELEIHKQAEKELLKLAKINPQAFDMVNLGIIKLTDNLFNSNLWIKKLKGEFDKFFCIKIGKYRIKFRIKNNIITIYDIQLRKDAYK